MAEASERSNVVLGFYTNAGNLSHQIDGLRYFSGIELAQVNCTFVAGASVGRDYLHTVEVAEMKERTVSPAGMMAAGQTAKQRGNALVVLKMFFS